MYSEYSSNLCKFTLTVFVCKFSYKLRLLSCSENLSPSISRVCRFFFIFYSYSYSLLPSSSYQVIYISIKLNLSSICFFCFYSARQDCNTFQSMSKVSQSSYINIFTHSHFNHYNLPDYYHMYDTKRYLLSY